MCDITDCAPTAERFSSKDHRVTKNYHKNVCKCDNLKKFN